MTANTELQNATITYTLNLERFGVQHGRDVVSKLEELETELLKELQGRDITSFTRKRLTGLLKGTSETINGYYTGISGTNAATMADVVKLNKKHTKGVIDGLLGADLVSVGLHPTRVSAIVRNTLIDGATAPDWWKEQGATLDSKYERVIRSGLFTGKTTQQISTDIRRMFGVPKHQADTLARTSVIAVNNDAGLDTIAQNKDIMKGVQWISTLDGRTSHICKGLDGLVWAVSDDYRQYSKYKALGHRKRFPGPIAHWQCRSTQGMVMKDASQIFDKPTEIKPTTRASVNGEVPETKTYETWLRDMPEAFQKSVLGPKRWKLWNDKKITTAELTDINNRPLTFKELEEKASAGLLVPMINDDELYDFAVPTDAEYSDPAFHMTRAREWLEDNGIEFEDKSAIDKELEKVTKESTLVFNKMIKSEGLELEKLQKEFQELADRQQELILRLRGKQDLPNLDKLFVLLSDRIKTEDINKILSDWNPQVNISKSVEKLFNEQTVNFIGLFQGRGLDQIPKIQQRSVRAYFMENRRIDIGRQTRATTILHELAHSLEYSDPRIFKATLQFVKDRNRERGFKSLRELTGSNFYNANERVYEDEFIDPYVGKVYAGGSEVVSMGVQHFTTSSELLKLVRGDFEHFLLTLGLML